MGAGGPVGAGLGGWVSGLGGQELGGEGGSLAWVRGGLQEAPVAPLWAQHAQPKHTSALWSWFPAAGLQAC